MSQTEISANAAIATLKRIPEPLLMLAAGAVGLLCTA